jgi:NADH-quinone oxidoreductase subunit H
LREGRRDSVLDYVGALLYLLVFPGFAFLMVYALFCEWVDRKAYARMQHRIGPPWFQPLADFIKLLAKEDIIPQNAERTLFQYAPLVALAAAMAPIINIPIWSTRALYAFQGDLIVVLYMLSIPTLALFIIGWASGSIYPLVGSMRAATMIFSYEVPLILACLSAGILSGSWRISDVTTHLATNPFEMLLLIPGFTVALFALQAKLERTPFDIPHAETEIVGGTITECSGKKLALMRLVGDIVMVAGATLFAAIFLGGFMLHDGFLVLSGFDFTPMMNFVFYLIKTLFIVFLLATIKTLFARLRIDQMISFSWKYLALVGVFQLFIALFYVSGLKGVT